VNGVPISIALLFCIPIGFLFYFEARWLIRYTVGDYGQRERRVARLLGVFGVALIPLIYSFGLVEDAFPGRLGKVLANGVIVVAGLGFTGSILAALNERK
jgi:hypothetical protein